MIEKTLKNTDIPGVELLDIFDDDKNLVARKLVAIGAGNHDPNH